MNKILVKSLSHILHLGQGPKTKWVFWIKHNRCKSINEPQIHNKTKNKELSSPSFFNLANHCNTLRQPIILCLRSIILVFKSQFSLYFMTFLLAIMTDFIFQRCLQQCLPFHIFFWNVTLPFAHLEVESITPSPGIWAHLVIALANRPRKWWAAMSSHSLLERPSLRGPETMWKERGTELSPAFQTSLPRHRHVREAIMDLPGKPSH